MPKWKTRSAAWTLTLLSTPVIIAACSSWDDSQEGTRGTTGQVRQAEGEGEGEVDPLDCNEHQQSDTLEQFSDKCDRAIGETVTDFDCDTGTEVPETNLSGTYPFQTCDRPNVLRGECDPGSRFQVLKQTDDVAIVGHCRKQGNAPGFYGDIAVIQYNRKNGATCFYQALGTLSHDVKAPSKGIGAYTWKKPSETAGINCVQCHDTGPFVRSPYLAQLGDEPVNRLPGTHAGPGPWDQRFSWNQNLPYRFVGSDFQSWKAYSISTQGGGAACTGCHRLGISSVAGQFNESEGTAIRFGPIATASDQQHKNSHSETSPIWMKPGQVNYVKEVHDEQAVPASDCARAIAKRRNNPAAPAPPPGCHAVRFAHGDTCRSAPIQGEVNGPLQSTPTEGRVDTIVTVGEGCASGNCPISFCYWKVIHGPFWQQTPTHVPIGSDAYRGGFQRIYAENGSWKIRGFSDSTGVGLVAPPGGVWECTNFRDIASVPDPGNCGSNIYSVADPVGNVLMSEVELGPNEASIGTLSGIIGNVAQYPGDALKLFDNGGARALMANHALAAPPFIQGPLQGEAFANACGNSYVSQYEVKDVLSSSDVSLVPAHRAYWARCFISGITGAWSSTGSGGAPQPYAQIYTGAGGDIRLRVVNPPGSEGVSAYGSCFRLD